MRGERGILSEGIGGGGSCIRCGAFVSQLGVVLGSLDRVQVSILVRVLCLFRLWPSGQDKWPIILQFIKVSECISDDQRVWGVWSKCLRFCKSYRSNGRYFLSYCDMHSNVIDYWGGGGGDRAGTAVHQLLKHKFKPWQKPWQKLMQKVLNP